ncbi:hypothetical protein LCGC14_1047950 [marine sediment metagenome]|uniref:Glycosyl transferase family 1 domain-containing protein n=1 Tax=marine sediment metagenome TaxID=412755 RepID=A0A0F9MU71_9ZZZZ
MRIVHSLSVTPGACGLYETANELIVAEQNLGVTVAVANPLRPRKQDVEALQKCDLIVDHSGLTGDMWKAKKPIIHVRHGRPHSTFLMEEQGNKKVYSFLRNSRRRYDAIVTFWDSHVPYLELMFGRQDIHVIPAPVDLEKWCPEGSVYDFGKNKGVFNIVCADVFRRDEDPFHVVSACGLLPEGYKIHLVGLKGGLSSATKALVGSLGKNRGSLFSWIKGLSCLYRAADLVISPHKIATRAIRESMACGTPVLADLGNPHTKWVADAHNARKFCQKIQEVFHELQKFPDNGDARNHAVMAFDPRNTATRFLKVAESVLEGTKVLCNT